MYNSAKQGWYKVLNVKKFIMQTNESKSVMSSVRINEGNLEINFIIMRVIYPIAQK